MTPRAKGRLVGLLILAALTGLLVYAVASAPPPDLMRVAKEFLRQQDEGTAFEAVAAPASALRKRWDPVSIEHATQVRIQALGRFVRVVSEQPAKEFHEEGLALRRVRARLAFEKREVDAVFTFRQMGRWFLFDFDVPLKDPASLGRADELLRRSAAEALEQYGRHRFDLVWRMLARRVRIAGDMEQWQIQQGALVEPQGIFQRVEPGAWTHALARGVLEARLVFEQGTLRAEVEAVFDGTEGRVVLARFDVKP